MVQNPTSPSAVATIDGSSTAAFADRAVRPEDAARDRAQPAHCADHRLIHRDVDEIALTGPADPSETPRPRQRPRTPPSPTHRSARRPAAADPPADPGSPRCHTSPGARTRSRATPASTYGPDNPNGEIDDHHLPRMGRWPARGWPQRPHPRDPSSTTTSARSTRSWSSPISTERLPALRYWNSAPGRPRGRRLVAHRPAAQRIAARRFEFDDVRARVDEQLAAVLAADAGGDLQDLQARERRSHLAGDAERLRIRLQACRSRSPAS